MEFFYDSLVLAMTAPRSTATLSTLADPDDLLRGRLLKVIVTGDRHWMAYRLVCTNLDRFTIGELHQGGAPGADRCGKRWAISRNVAHFEHPADWTTFGRAGGPLRNIDMHKSVAPDLVVAFKNNFGANPRGGTEHMVSLAWGTGTPVWHVDELGARWLPPQ